MRHHLIRLIVRHPEEAGEIIAAGAQTIVAQEDPGEDTPEAEAAVRRNRAKNSDPQALR